MVTKLGAYIEAFKDRMGSDIWSNAAIGRRVGVSRATVGNWISEGAMPRPENLRALATLMDVSYSRLLDAVLEDMGYLGEGGGHRVTAAPNTPAVLGDMPWTAPEWDVAAAALRQAGLAESYIVKHIGSRPVAHPPGDGGTAGGIGQARGA